MENPCPSERHSMFTHQRIECRSQLTIERGNFIEKLTS